MIDAHQHVWRIGRNGCVWPTSAEGPIYRDFDFADYRAESGPHGVVQSVLVQSQEDARDTDWLLDVAEREDGIAAVVGWADFTAPAAASRIAALAARPKLKALRPMVQDRAADWYDDPALEPAFAALAACGLRLDALVRVPHLAALDRLAARFPQLPIVIDHAAKPRIGSRDGFDAWHNAMAPLAARPNVFCKLSGLITECAGTGTGATEPFINAILTLFGPQRTMWGSDWPVLELAATFSDWLDLARTCVVTEARTDVFGGTAARFYDLHEARAR